MRLSQCSYGLPHFAITSCLFNECRPAKTSAKTFHKIIHITMSCSDLHEIYPVMPVFPAHGPHDVLSHLIQC